MEDMVTVEEGGASATTVESTAIMLGIAGTDHGLTDCEEDHNM